MNYNKHLEELQKFRDAIRDIQNEVEGVAVDLGNYVDEVEKQRDDAVRRGAPITFTKRERDGGGLTNEKDKGSDMMPGEKLYKEGKIIDESVQKWWKKLAGING